MSDPNNAIEKSIDNLLADAGASHEVAQAEVGIEFSREFLRMLGITKRKFLGRTGLGSGIKVELKRHQDAESWRHKHLSRRKNRLPRIDRQYSAFATSLGSPEVRRRKIQNGQQPTVDLELELSLNGESKLTGIEIVNQTVSFASKVSVFVISIFGSNPPKFMVQKVQKKKGLGWPGGTIRPGETEGEAAAREYKGETGLREGAGIDIGRYSLLPIGDFELANAIHGERGVVMLVELPESEKANARTGQGEDDDEIIEKIYYCTEDQLEDLILEDGARYPRIMANSIMAWEVFKRFMSSLDYQSL